MIDDQESHPRLFAFFPLWLCTRSSMKFSFEKSAIAIFDKSAHIKAYFMILISHEKVSTERGSVGLLALMIVVT